jgi:hypothetical protein
LLTNVTSIGHVRYQNEVHPGEQPAIVELATWQDVQALLAANGQARAERSASRCRPTKPPVPSSCRRSRGELARVEADLEREFGAKSLRPVTLPGADMGAGFQLPWRRREGV